MTLNDTKTMGYANLNEVLDWSLGLSILQLEMLDSVSFMFLAFSPETSVLLNSLSTSLFQL